MRTSPYKDTIISILKSSHLLSLQEVHERLPQADFSTIFRNLEQLCRDGVAQKVMVSKDTVLYEAVGTRAAHDHFVCTNCGEIASVVLPKKNLSLPSGSVVTDVMIRGVCGVCNE